MCRMDSALFAASVLFASSAIAAEPSVAITAPMEGAKVGAMMKTELMYEVEPGPKGDHTHLYMDGKEVAVLRKLKGMHMMEAMPAGSHDICIKVVDKGHTPIGVQKCIKVTAQ